MLPPVSSGSSAHWFLSVYLQKLKNYKKKYFNPLKDYISLENYGEYSKPGFKVLS